MNRSNYFNYIEEKLNTLGHRINKRGKLNILDLNIHSENFFEKLLNIVYKWELTNMNVVKQNIEAIDLKDDKNKLVVQVSATSTRAKITTSLNNKMYEKYTGYRFKFISISKDVKGLKKNAYKNPYKIEFDYCNDIIGVVEILNAILNMDIDKQKILYDFHKNELGNDIDVYKVDSNLTQIINILADENLVEEVNSLEINSFEIERKINFNDLNEVKDTINDYKIYYSKLDEKYSEFDSQGKNKSLSVFNLIRKEYQRLNSNGKSSKNIFFELIEKVVDFIISSKNYNEMPYEELEMCVFIIIVDAFVRCKIFKNPEGYKHVIAR